jgi:hypothetical protein
MKRTASSSDVQQLAEGFMVSALSKDLGRTLTKATVPIGKSSVSVDGFHREDGRVILAEAWAHMGKVRAAQRNKVLTDMLKLILIETALRRSHPALAVECYLVFADATAASVVKGHSWAAAAASEFGIRPHVVTLSEDIIDAIREAQRRQDIRLPDEY